LSTLCLTFDNMGRAREIGEGLASRPDPDEPSLAVGYPRLLALLDELDLKGTFFIEGWNALHHPQRVRELAERGHEVGLHGWVHERFGSLDAKRAEQLLYDGTAAMERIGLHPKGFRAPGAARGEKTAGFLKALGFAYDGSSGPNDAPQPSLLLPGLAHVPWRPEMVDSIQYLRHPTRPRTPAELQSSWLKEIDSVREGETLTIVIHAFVSGVDEERFAVVRKVLGRARERLKVKTARAVADEVLSPSGP
jgi:peptidoglycan-N-acetylglucosamine deacetylase